MNYSLISFHSNNTCLTSIFRVLLTDSKHNVPETYSEFKLNVFCNLKHVSDRLYKKSHVLDSWICTESTGDKVNNINYPGIICNNACFTQFLFDLYYLSQSAYYTSNLLDDLNSEDRSGEFYYIAR